MTTHVAACFAQKKPSSFLDTNPKSKVVTTDYNLGGAQNPSCRHHLPIPPLCSTLLCRRSTHRSVREERHATMVTLRWGTVMFTYTSSLLSMSEECTQILLGRWRAAMVMSRWGSVMLVCSKKQLKGNHRSREYFF